MVNSLRILKHDYSGENACDRLAILVLGMHRSGTSALSRLIALAGAELPQKMILATEGNRTGHWESFHLVQKNDEILQSFDLTWDEWRPLRPPERIEQHAAEISRVVLADFNQADLIVIKDPRICRLTPIYLSGLNALKYRVFPVLALRHPQEVIHSLTMRSNWSDDKCNLDAALLWLTYTLEAEYATRHLERAIVSYDRTLDNWPAILDEVEQRSGRIFPQKAGSIAKAVDQFLNPADRHHQFPDKALLSDPVTLGWVSSAYNAMRKLEVDPKSVSAKAVLDQVRNELNAAKPMLSLVMEERRALFGTARELQKAADEAALSARAELADLQKLADERQNALDAARRLTDENSRAAQAEMDKMRNLFTDQLKTAEVMFAQKLRLSQQEAAAERAELLDQMQSTKKQAAGEIDRLRASLKQSQKQVRIAAASSNELAKQLRFSEEQSRLSATAFEQRLQQSAGIVSGKDLELAQMSQQISALQEAASALEKGLQLERAAFAHQIASVLEASDAKTQNLLLAQDQVYRSSTSWRITAPLRFVGDLKNRAKGIAKAFKSTTAMLGGAGPTFKIAKRVLQKQGLAGFAAQLRQYKARGYQLTAISSSLGHSGNYVNQMAAGRGDVLFSEWHVGLINALWDDRTPEVHGPTLGLSLVTYNSARWLPGFLSSLLEQGFPLSRLNVLVVDHGSQDGSDTLIDEHIAKFQHLYASFTLHRRANLGFGCGHDFAIRQLTDDFVLVSNVDLQFHHNSLTQALRGAMADREDVAAWELRQCPYEHPKYYDPVTLEAVWNSHACVLLRRKAYLAVGGYDDHIFMYGEDVELSYRFRGAGWRLRYLPQVTITHFVDLTDTELRPNQLAGSLAANVLLRYRYGGDARGVEGEALLAATLAAERDPVRRAGMIEAQTRILANKDHFRKVHKPTHAADFPFEGFDYTMARDGAHIAGSADNPKEMTHKVSVITRTYGANTELLKEALVAVINQSYGNIEHIVVEDRTDFAADLVARVAEVYGRDIQYHKSDGSGRSAAGNFGLQVATGELLLFLDNDDLLFSDHIEVLQKKLAASPKIQAAYALGWDVQTLFDGRGGYTEMVHILPPGHRFAFDRTRLKDMNFIPIQAILFHRRLFEMEGGFDLEIDYLEDWNLWSRYSNYGDFEMVPKLTSMYRTPADPQRREERQRNLDAAYLAVKDLNSRRAQEIGR